MKKKNFTLPTAYTTLFILIAIIAVLSWIIPAGEWSEDFSQYTRLEESKQQGLWNLIAAPIEGFNEAKDIIIFVLVIGGLINILVKTQALEGAISNLLKVTRGREQIMIPVLMLFFSIGGTSFGMAEETIGFYLLLIPIFLAVGYDTMTVFLVAGLGSGVGVLGSTINPFATGVASGIAGISPADGLGTRIIIWTISTSTAIIFTMRYAQRVRRDIQRSAVADLHEEHKKIFLAGSSFNEEPAYTSRHKAIIIIFGLTFVIMILGVIPWKSKFDINLFANLYDFTAQLPIFGKVLGLSPTSYASYLRGLTGSAMLGDWWFGQMSVLFLISAILISVIARFSEAQFAKYFIEGAEKLFGVAAIIGVARGIQVLMAGSGMDATILYWGSKGLKNIDGALLAVASFLFYIPMSFLIPSSSGLATATMPVMAPLARLLGLEPSIFVTAYQSACGLVNLVTPTSGVIMGAVALTRVPYERWLKILMPILGLNILIVSIALVLNVWY